MNMKLPGVDWDESKNAINKAKHKGLSFEAAQYVFSDPNRIERRDESEGNTSGEERRQTLGMVHKVLMVVYTEIGETKKIISARLAEGPERRSYHGYYQIDGKGWEKNS
ncbi:membrane protein [Spirochaetia bacterium]|nr:membrane protein [Spirochaetia bacterium]